MLINLLSSSLHIALATKTHTRIYIDSLIMKFILAIFVLLLLNGCAQHTALLGPMYTIGSTGNVLQASASYGTGYVVRKATGKTTAENVEILLETEKAKKLKKVTESNPADFFRIVKKYLKKENKIDVTASQ